MKRPGDLSIHAKLNLLVAMAAGSALALACAAFVVNDSLATRASTTGHLSAIASVLGANSVAALTFNDHDAATELLSSLKLEPIVLYACIYDPEGRSFAVYRRDPAQRRSDGLQELPEDGHWYSEDGSLSILASIGDSDGQVGRIFLKASMEQLTAQYRWHAVTALVVLLVSLAASMLLSSQFQKVLSRPIMNLAATAERISSEQDYSLRVVCTSRDEIGSLYTAFNQMLDQIEDGKRSLKEAHDALEIRVFERTRELAATNSILSREIAERNRAEAELHDLQKQHLATARQAGMAEVASSVLHNVGNVLNSVNVSATLINERLRKSCSADLLRVVEIVEAHLDDIGAYVSRDERGKHLPKFLIELGRQLAADEAQLLTEIELLARNIEHIKDIVSLQQSYAGVSGVVEEIPLTELLEDAIRINEASILRHGVDVIREFSELPAIAIEKQKFLQIVVNLVSNAKYAAIQSGRPDGKIWIRMFRREDFVHVEVVDNGVGIKPENLTRIFSHGFTTRKEGHGFGLHSAANSANEMGGALRVRSEGPGLGAVFTLELPVRMRNCVPCALTESSI